MSLIIIAENILNNIMGNKIQQHIIKIIHHDRIDFIPGIQVYPFSPLLFDIVLEILVKAIRQKEETKGIHIKKE
jgi:hypothetical protein